MSTTAAAVMSGLVLMLEPRTSLVAFGGVLVAVLQDTDIRPVMRWGGWFHGWTLAAVLVAVTLAIAGAVRFIGPQVADEADPLQETLPASYAQAGYQLARSATGRWVPGQVDTVWSAVNDNRAAAGGGWRAGSGGGSAVRPRRRRRLP